jgi:phenylacetic acid degradation operon negative regulatory protein
MAIRLTARSVVLSVLLGAHPAWATAAELLRLTEDFDIKETTLRVALTRMVAAGDLVRSEDGYRLSDRLLARQRRQDDALNPHTRHWDGNWLTAIVTAVGADARSRASLRIGMQHKRFGELREGVWLRPDNLAFALPDEADGRVRVLRSRDDDPGELAGRLWDLPGWSRTGRNLLQDMKNADGIPEKFTAAAGMVRHLLTDPVLPEELLPAGWPGRQLRDSYAEFAAQLMRSRQEEFI